MRVRVELTANIDSDFLKKYIAARGLSSYSVLEFLRVYAKHGFDELQTHFENTGNDHALKYECSINKIKNNQLPSLQG